MFSWDCSTESSIMFTSSVLSTGSIWFRFLVPFLCEFVSHSDTRPAPSFQVEAQVKVFPLETSKSQPLRALT